MKSLGPLVVICIVIALGVIGFLYLKPSPEPIPVPEKVQPVLEDSVVEAYVRENISALSPEPEQLGGTFYVTSIDAHDGSGTVSYEDGHNAYTARFMYAAGPGGEPQITEFVVE